MVLQPLFERGNKPQTTIESYKHAEKEKVLIHVDSRRNCIHLFIILFVKYVVLKCSLNVINHVRKVSCERKSFHSTECDTFRVNRSVLLFLPYLYELLLYYLTEEILKMTVRLLIVMCTHITAAAAPLAPAADASRTAGAALARLYWDQLSVYVVGALSGQSQEQIDKGQRHVQLATRRERHCARGGLRCYFATRCAPLVQTTLQPQRPIFSGSQWISRSRAHSHPFRMSPEMVSFHCTASDNLVLINSWMTTNFLVNNIGKCLLYGARSFSDYEYNCQVTICYVLKKEQANPQQRRVQRSGSIFRSRRHDHPPRTQHAVGRGNLKFTRRHDSSKFQRTVRLPPTLHLIALLSWPAAYNKFS